MATTAVRVALRVRPLNSKEKAAHSQECITFATDEPQIFLGSDRAFTFDNVFKPDSTQKDVYNKTVVPLVDRFIEGNNVTILAYGQTGSGKTYSMGTGIEIEQDDDQGVVQRFAHQLFDALEKSNTKGARGEEDSFQVYVSFLELYHEDLNDLLEPHRDTAENHPSIREALDGSIYWAGVREERVYNAQELLGLLRQGATFRATGSTDVNAASSRSHAVFSVLLKQQLTEDNNNNEDVSSIDKLPIMKRIASKFHFVDLAGSERLKRTMGDRQKEGISINTGLLALGNVISALGDEARKGSHVPYRDSKLTRLLQDSLGGNSHTLMLACVSPADADYMKTLNTLKYAGRARNIQNRVEINHDYEGSPDELQFLRRKLSQLKMQMSILQKVQNHHPQHHTPLNLDQNNHSDPLFIPHQQMEEEDDHHYDSSYQLQQQKEELARMRQYNQATSAELAKVQSERDTLLAQMSPDHVMTEAHPVIRQYAETVEALKLQLSEAHHHLAKVTNNNGSDGEFLLPKKPASPTMVSTSTVTYGNHSGPSEDLYCSQSTAVPGRYGADAAIASSSSSTWIDRDIMRSSYRPVVTLSGRRQKRPIAQRMKTHSRKRGDNANHSTNTKHQSTTEKLMQMMAMTNGSVFTNAESTSFTSHGRQRKSQDETVIQDLSGVETTTSDLFLCSNEERDHNGNSEFDNNSTRTMEQDPFIHPTHASGTSSSSISCEKIDDFDDSDGELEALAVPTFTNAPRAAQSTNGSTKRESLSWTDSLLDDSDNSVATSRLSSSWTSSSRQHGHGGHHGNSTAGRRRSKDLLKMLHQVQADLLVKKELVGQLEKSEDEYTQMRSTYEDKLNELHEHLMETEKERDDALLKQPGSSHRSRQSTLNSNAAGTTTNYTRRTARAMTGSLRSATGATTKEKGGENTLPPTAAPNVMQLRETRQVDDVRRLFEQKLKKLSTENQELKRKYTQTHHTLQTARQKAEAFVSKMQSEIETLKLEKKQIQKVYKSEQDKSRDRIAQYERDMQVMKRREVTANENRKKLEEQQASQEQFIKRRNEEVAAITAQLRQLTTNLRRAATEGIMLNEAALDRILNTKQRATRSPSVGRRATPTPTFE